MSIQTDKLKLIQLLLKTENHTIIENIKSIFQTSNEQTDIWEELSDGQKNEIDKALEESMNNLTVDYDSFMGDFRK